MDILGFKDIRVTRFYDPEENMKKLKFGKVKVKKISSKTWKAKAWTVFSKYIRMRDCLHTAGRLDYGQCFTCDQYHFIQDLDASHFTQGRHLSTMFIEDNVHACCTGCNRFKHGNLIEYTIRMQKEYGIVFVDDLRALDRVSKTLKAKDYEEIYKTYSLKIKEMESL